MTWKPGILLVGEHRTRQWTSAQTREVILDAAYELIREATQSPEATPFPEVSVPEVARKASVLWELRHPDKPRQIGPGAVRTNFQGGQPGLVMATILARVGLGQLHSAVAEFRARLAEAKPIPDRTERHEAVLTAHADFVASDFVHMTDAGETTTYINLIAHHQNPEVQTLIRTIYRAFDSELIPLYEEMLACLDLQLKGEYSIGQFSAALTAITEGLGMRSVIQRPADTAALELISVAMASARGVILSMTEPR